MDGLESERAEEPSTQWEPSCRGCGNRKGDGVAGSISRYFVEGTGVGRIPTSYCFYDPTNLLARANQRTDDFGEGIPKHDESALLDNRPCRNSYLVSVVQPPPPLPFLLLFPRVATCHRELASISKISRIYRDKIEIEIEEIRGRSGDARRSKVKHTCAGQNTSVEAMRCLVRITGVRAAMRDGT
uniref:Uncharacterized protein n=1 Tax=Vespula pensylvanica TaxID=30213 RepID=A0A834JLH3_VESPE|nr:hypothetical protein H0235_018278 [Vespula pensylvanica]